MIVSKVAAAVRTHVLVKGLPIPAYLALGLVIGLGGGVAYSAIPDGGGVIHACYSDTTGSLRLTDPDDGVPRPCQSGETALDWNQQGPQGPPGQQGPQGPPGAAGASLPTERMLDSLPPHATEKPPPLPNRTAHHLVTAPPRRARPTPPSRTRISTPPINR